MNEKIICPVCYSEDIVAERIPRKASFWIECKNKECPNFGKKVEYSKFKIEKAIVEKEQGFCAPKDYWDND